MDTDTTPTPTASAYTQHEYADDVVSLLAQLRDVGQHLRSLELSLVPLVTTEPANWRRALNEHVRPVDGPDAGDAWGTYYHANVVERLARAAESAVRDAALVRARWTAAEGDR